MGMNIWWAVPVLIGLIGLGLLLGGLGRMFQFRMGSGLSRILFSWVFLGGALAAALFGMNLQTYSRLTHERVAAEVTLTQTAPQVYKAFVRLPDAKGELGPASTYALTGDEFRIEARFLKWRPWANITGFDAIYRLDRLEGRYSDVVAENATPPTAYDLSPKGASAALDIYRLARSNDMVKKLNAVDVISGQGAYIPMADGAVYKIMATQWSLLPRPDNEQAKAAVAAWGGPVSEPDENEVRIETDETGEAGGASP